MIDHPMDIIVYLANHMERVMESQRIVAEQRDKLERERDELRQQLEAQRKQCDMAVDQRDEEIKELREENVGFEEVNTELRQQLEACNARDKYQPGGLIDSAEPNARLNRTPYPLTLAPSRIADILDQIRAGAYVTCQRCGSLYLWTAQTAVYHNHGQEDD